VLDVTTRFVELGEALLPLINPAVQAKYGIEITSFVVENVSVPPEVEQAIDKSSSMKAIGNLNDFVKYQMAKGFEDGTGGGSAGTAAELAVGFGIAQQMMQQGFGGSGPAPAAAAELLAPADVARILKVSELDVMAIIQSNELKAKKIGSTWRVTRAALDAYLAQ
jgi:excisionase family DNA binding protein